MPHTFQEHLDIAESLLFSLDFPPVTAERQAIWLRAIAHVLVALALLHLSRKDDDKKS